jgi:hypothetical protein
MYNPNMTPADNYRHTTGAWAFIDPGLEQRYPDHFAEIYTTYDPDLAEVKARLVELEQA